MLLEKKHLSATDRYGILDDSFALSTACLQSFASLLTLLGAYREELDYIVLSNLITIPYKLARIAADAVPDLLDLINQFFLGLFQCSAEYAIRMLPLCCPQLVGKDAKQLGRG